MTDPVIPVSWGELLDKIAILEIKTHRLRSREARDSAAHELTLLRRAAAGLPRGTVERRRVRDQLDVRTSKIAELGAALLAVNTRLWRIEDLIREKEAAGDFGPGFIALARAVYHENDERGRIKQAINRALRSALVEAKQYSAY
jgi:hypothetical protein